MTQTKQPPLTEWMDALVEAANELAESLGFAEGVIVSRGQALPRDVSCSCIALVGDEASLQIGLGANNTNAIQLARALFCLEPEDDDPEEQDVADALGEMANIVAGGVKTRMVDYAASMQLGLPIVLHGQIVAAGDAEVAAVTVRWSEIEAQLLLLRHNGG